MRTLLFVALAAAAACSKPPAPGAPADYRARDGSFSAAVPGNWRVDDSPADEPGAAFFGPPEGPAPYSQMMSVTFHRAADGPSAARLFVASELQQGVGPLPAPGKDGALDETFDRTVPDVHRGPQRVTTRVVAVPAPGGFYSLEYSRPAGTSASPVFDGLLRTFKPGSAGK